MNLLERIDYLEARIKAQARKIATLESTARPKVKPEKRKSKYQCKIKITGPISRTEMHARIDRKFQKRNAKKAA